MVAMESTAPASNDIEAITDLVMNRQLIDFPRERARAIVAMVLDCAAEAAVPAVGSPPTDATRLDVTIVSTMTVVVTGGRGYFDEVTFVSDWDVSPIVTGTAATPIRVDHVPTELTVQLQELSLHAHNVALWVVEDGSNQIPTIVEVEDHGKRT